MHCIRKALVVSLFTLLTSTSALALAQQQSADNMALPGRLYVQFTDDNLRMSAGRTGMEAFDRKARRYQVTAIEKAFPSLEVIASHRPLAPSTEALRRVYIVHYDALDLPRNVAKDFASLSSVRYAEPIYKKTYYGPTPGEIEARQRATPDDPSYSSQAHLPFLQLDKAWDVVKGLDSTAVIGIVDGGTHWRHEDLIGNVWTNPNEIDGDGIDNDGNGYVDDIHGWNFENNTPDPSGPPNTLSADHGTAVAGVAAAVSDNGIGISGASWNAQFMGVGVSCSDGEAVCYPLEGTLYAALTGADVITASYGGPQYSATDEMVYQSATDEGALIVAAAGNEGTDNDISPVYPASYRMVLSVGATDKSSDINFLNYGKTVNVFAPGNDIEVTTPNDQYNNWAGTSFSVPLTAGVAALVKTAFPHFDAHQLREHIRLTAVSIDHANTAPGKYGNGKVNAYAAVTQAPLPGIRVTDWSYQNQDARRGDTVEVTISFTNYHGDGSGLSAELVPGASALEWLISKVSLGSMNKGDTTDATFQFIVDKSAPPRLTVPVNPIITAAGLEDSPDLLLPILVNQTLTVEHTTAQLKASVTEEGNIGHRDYFDLLNPPNIKGFEFERADGIRQEMLFEGGLLIATSPAQVSDCLRQDPADDLFDLLNPSQEMDWAPAAGSRLEYISPGQRASQESRVTLDDLAAASPIGVEVLQETFVEDGSMNEDFIIYRYTITNKSPARIEDMYVGVFFDWDLGNNFENRTGFDSSREVGYVLDSKNSPLAVAGTLLLTSQTLNYSAINNEEISQFSGDGFTPAEKWHYLTGGVRNGGVITDFPANVSQMTSAGPINLDAGAEVTVAFAIISGKNEADFLTNADNAQTLWNTIVVSATPDTPPTASWEIHSPYPHPTVFPVTFRFETAASSVVQLEIFDLLGRRVRQLLDAPRSGGVHEVVWDGHSSSGIRVAPGMYMARMTAKHDSQVYRRSRSVIVLH